MALNPAIGGSGSFRFRGGLLRELDLITIGSVAGLVVMGLLSIFTSTVDPDQGTSLGLQASSALFNRQLVFLVLAGATMIAAVFFDYRYFKVYAVVMYLVCIFLLLVVMTPLGDA